MEKQKVRYSPWITPADEKERQAWEEAIGYYKENGIETFYSHANVGPMDVVASEEDHRQGNYSVMTKNRPMSEDEMCELFKVDRKHWVVTHFTVNTWGVGYKTPLGQIASEPLYQSKLKLARPHGVDYGAIAAAIADAAKGYKFAAGKPAPAVAPGLYALEIIVTDHHFGKVGADGFSWTLDEARDAYKAAVKSLLAQAKAANGGKDPEEIIMPIGNDLLHWDNVKQQTTAGTQMNGHVAHYSDIFAEALSTVMWAIEYASQHCERVYVPMVQGNHDRSSICAMAVALMAIFADSRKVKVLFDPSGRVYHEYGNCLIGYHHFDVVDTKSIAGIVNADLRTRGIVGDYRFYYVHGGHHHKGKTLEVFNSKDEFGGIEVAIFPALCPADSFHNDNGYIGKSRKATAITHHPLYGKMSEYYFDIERFKSGNENLPF